MKGLPSILLALVAFCAESSAVAAVVEGVRSYRAPDYTRLVFDLDGPIQYVVNTKDPVQVIIQLQSTTIRGDLSHLNLVDTPIASIGSSQLEGGDTQLVLALNALVDPRSFTLGKNEQYGDRLVIDLYDKVPAAAKALVAESNDSSDAIGALSASLDAGGKRDIIVAISAGHGGDDPGAIGVRKLEEKQVTLAISQAIAEQLNATEGYQAVLIREGDYYVGLRDRIKRGHDENADLYLAIHADAADNKNASGATVYALSDKGATSEQARRLADKENSSDLIGGVGSVSLNDKDAVLASVLLDLSMTASVATSLEIGAQMIESLNKVTELRREQVEQAAFVELKSADIPSLLIESGYITNAEDAKQLDSKAWRKQFAGAIVDGITAWFNERPPRGSLIAWQQANSAKSANPSTHTVQRGDSLSQIATDYSVSLAAIKAANQLKSDTIRTGQVLKIPPS